MKKVFLSKERNGGYFFVGIVFIFFLILTIYEFRNFQKQILYLNYIDFFFKGFQ